MAELQTVGHNVRKVDAVSLTTGAARFTDDFALPDALHLQLVYSPHAHAEIVDIDTTEAQGIPGVVDILHFKNVPRIWHTTAGQGFPEPSPYDNVLFDSVVRFVGDRVAMVAAETADIARQAAAAIRVTYRPLAAVFTTDDAMRDGAPRLHGEEEHAAIPVSYRPEINQPAEVGIHFGDLERGLTEADFIEDHTYSTHIASHCAIEPHAALAHFDEKGRLVVISTTQVPFHARRIITRIVGIPPGMVRVVKPRIGGGFGGKQEVILEPLVALVAWKHKRPARLVLSRKEVFVSSRTRHGMTVRLQTGARAGGEITALDMDAVMNAGAYGTHALTVLSNTGSKVLPLFNKIPNVRFSGKSIYTNLPVGGAYRGYGATQGYFAFCQQMDMIARRTGQDLIDFYKKWHIREGETSDVFKVLGEGKEGVEQVIRSCKLDECIDRGAAGIDWYGLRDKRIRTGPHTVRGVGMAIAMQGSAIPRVDMASASMKINEDGSFSLFVGATDIGTGSDTILSQIAAEVLQVPVEHIWILSSDTDLTPFDTGAYASSTTYLSGEAVRKCADKIKQQVLAVGAGMLKAEPARVELRSGAVVDPVAGRSVSLQQIAYRSFYSRDQFQIQASASHVGDESPPPFCAQFAEVEVDLQTGRTRVVKFVSAIDCGQAIHPQMVEGQVEGAVLNGISYALCEQYRFNAQGAMVNASFGDYKIYSAPDVPLLETYVVSSYEETGPFGAKSVGEIGINGPLPAIANGIFDATGVRLFEAPFRPETLWAELRKRG